MQSDDKHIIVRQGTRTDMSEVELGIESFAPFSGSLLNADPPRHRLCHV